MFAVSFIFLLPFKIFNKYYSYLLATPAKCELESHSKCSVLPYRTILLPRSKRQKLGSLNFLSKPIYLLRSVNSYFNRLLSHSTFRKTSLWIYLSMNKSSISTIKNITRILNCNWTLKRVEKKTISSETKEQT